MRLFALLLLGTAACGAERSLYFGFPDGIREGAAVVGFHLEDRFVAHAIDTGPSAVARLSVDLPSDATGRLQLLSYDAELDALGLPGGVLPDATEGDPLPATDVMFSASFEGEQVTAWTEDDSRTPELDAVRIPRPDRCVVFEPIDVFQLEGGADHRFTVSLDPDRALVVLKKDFLYVVTVDGVTRVTDYSRRALMSAAARLDEERVLLANEAGELLEARFSTSTTASGLRIDMVPVTQIPTATAIEHLAAAEVDGELEAFVLAEPSQLWHYASGGWQMLHDFGVMGTTASGVVRLGPRDVIAATDEKSEVVRWTDGRLQDFSPPDLANGVPGIALLPGFGPVLSISEGGLYVLRDDAWQFLPGSPLGLNVYSFFPFQDGLLFGSAFGFMGQYSESLGFCPEEVLLGTGAIRAVTPLGDKLLLSEDKPVSRDLTQVSIVDTR